MNINRCSVWVATLGPLGYYTASGMLVTLLTIPLVYLFHAIFSSQYLYLGVIAVMFACGIYTVSRALRQFARYEDPPEIVLDELVGCLFLFWGISLSAQTVVVGFLIFRLLDIITCSWMKKSEARVTAWGIMGDDIIAAWIANMALRVLF